MRLTILRILAVGVITLFLGGQAFACGGAKADTNAGNNPATYSMSEQNDADQNLGSDQDISKNQGQDEESNMNQDQDTKTDQSSMDQSRAY